MRFSLVIALFFMKEYKDLKLNYFVNYSDKTWNTLTRLVLITLLCSLHTGCITHLKGVQYAFEGRNYMKMYSGEAKSFEEIAVLRTYDEVYNRKLNYLYNITKINEQSVPNITHLVALEPGAYDITYDCHNMDSSKKDIKIKVNLKKGQCAVLSGGGFTRIDTRHCAHNLAGGISGASGNCSFTGVDYQRKYHSCSSPLKLVDEPCFTAYEQRLKREVKQELYYSNIEHYGEGYAEFVNPIH